MLILFGQPPALVPVQQHVERYQQQWISDDYRSRLVIVKLVYQWPAESHESAAAYHGRCRAGDLELVIRALNRGRLPAVQT